MISLEMTKLAMWVFEGETGKVMCTECNLKGKPDFTPDDHCFGCPKAYRVVDGQTEYYREPKHEYPRG